MKKYHLLFMALCLMLNSNAQSIWTVTNNSTVTTGGAAGSDHSGNLQYCVENAIDGDIINFDASLSGQTILFGDMGSSVLNPKAVTIDASSLASPVIFDGQSAYPIIKSTGGPTEGQTLKFKNIVFQNGKYTGTSDNAAGAIYACHHTVIENCKFSNNEQTRETGANAGAIMHGRRNAPQMEIRDCIFQGNKSGRRAGALFVSCATLVERCSFIENESVQTGAVCYVNNADGPDAGGVVEFRNCTMVNNKGQYVDGSIVHNNRNEAAKSTYLRFINCTIYGNSLESDTSIAAITSAFRKIEIGGCLMAKNAALGAESSDVKMLDMSTATTPAATEEIISLGYNTYNSIVRPNFTAQATDIVYANATWDAVPLASSVNAQGVMTPITTDAALFTTNIQRIPAETLTEWYGTTPVDQLGQVRTAPGSVGAYQASTINSYEALSMNNSIYTAGNTLNVKGAKGCNLSIYTLSGVLTNSVTVDSDFYTQNISPLTKGMYVVILINGNRFIETHKIVKY